MEMLGILVFGLGLVFLVAGVISFALNRGEPGSDEKAGEIGRDLFTMNNEPAEASMQPPGATGATESGLAAATHTAGN